MRALLLTATIYFFVAGAGAGSAALHAQEFDDQLWYRLAEADRALDERRFDDALNGYRSALRLRRPLPEADLGIATVLQIEGVAAEAENHFLSALENSEYFLLPENEYRARYGLASLYQSTRQYSKYSEALLGITDSEEGFQDLGQRRIGQRLLVNRGVDRLFEIYRFGNFYTLSAHAQLGEHFVVSGNYVRALDHLIYAVIKRGEQLEAIAEGNGLDVSGMSFTELLGTARGVRILNQNLRRGYDIDRILFYTGAAVYGHAPQSSTWTEVWSMVANSPHDNRWKSLAQARLNNPQLEPLLR